MSTADTHLAAVWSLMQKGSSFKQALNRVIKSHKLTPADVHRLKSKYGTEKGGKE